ncbi:MAG TPA: ATP/GTP-binding protein, partial [Parafilimonas sp.]|nr:ATP/GTP-binding protein [Parafilimonas sp.]
KLWSTDSTLAIPESVLYDAQNKLLYTSLINGKPDSVDGVGGIAKVSLDGKIENANWVTGLDAPKGLGKFGNTLYAADLTQVDVIDISTGKLTKRIPVPGAMFLNDITVDANGIVYVSDTRLAKVFRIENGNATEYLSNLKNANGVLAVNNDVYVLASGTLYKADANKKLTIITNGMDESTDGAEQVSGGDFIVSSWNGIVYYVKQNGIKETLFDTRAQKISSADIGYDAQNKIIYVPTFFGKSIVAYQLK